MKIPFRCRRCGECCKQMTGRRFGAAITPDEYRRLNAYAQRHGIKFEVKPLSVGFLGPTLYQFTQERCPFLLETRRGAYCRVYAIRPLLCRMFPLHPCGLMNCSFLESAKYQGVGVDFHPEQKAAVQKWAEKIQPMVKGANMLYDLNRGWRPAGRYLGRMQMVM